MRGVGTCIPIDWMLDLPTNCERRAHPHASSRELLAVASWRNSNHTLREDMGMVWYQEAYVLKHVHVANGL